MRRIALLVSLMMLFTSTVQTTYGFIVVATDPVINTFEPEAAISGDLIITKTVEHIDGAGHLVPGDGVFTFNVDLGQAYHDSHVTVIGGETPGRFLADANGLVTGIKMKAGQTVAIKGELDEGTQVTVTEVVEAGSPYYPKFNVASKTATITPGGASLEFVNVYDPSRVANVSVPVEVTKLVNNTSTGYMSPVGNFRFTLTDVTSGSAGPSTELVVGEDHTAKFTLSYTAENIGNTYKYNLTEVDSEFIAVNYDDTVWVLEVTVGGTPDNPQVSLVQNGTPVSAFNPTFTNEYAGTEIILPGYFASDMVSIVVEKEVKNTGSQSIGPEGFQFVLEDVTNAGQSMLLTEAPEMSENPTEIEVPDGGQPVGGGEQQPADQPDGGAQQPGELPGGGEPQQTPGEQQTPGQQTGGQEPAAPGEQTPAEQTPDEPQQTPADGGEQSGGEGAVLGWNDGQDEAAGTPEEGQPLTDTQLIAANLANRSVTRELRTVGADGKTTFEVHFTEEDLGKTFKYQLYEVNDGRAGVTYDPTVHEIVIEMVEMPGYFVLMVNGEMTGTYNATFTNTYKYTPGGGGEGGGGEGGDGGDGEGDGEVVLPPMDTIAVAVDKKVVNTGDVKLSREGFEFVLENLATGQKTVRTTGDTGKAIFYLSYLTEHIGKTYRYRVTEIPGDQPKVLYDPAVYEIYVEVVKDMYGFPEAQFTVNGQPYDDEKSYYTFLEFTNVELSGIKDTSLTVKARKFMENTGKDKIGPDGFQIVLTDVTDPAAEEPKVLKERTGKSGKADFELKYTVEDLGKTFCYTIAETDEGKQGVTYDTTVHEFRVAVGLEDRKLTAQLLLPASIAELYAEQNSDEKLAESAEEAIEATGSEAAETQWVAVDKWTAEFTNQFNVDKEPESGTDGEDKPGSETPRTGDSSHLNFWIFMMIVSGLATILLINAERRALRQK